jgi:hypothetical protein
MSPELRNRNVPSVSVGDTEDSPSNSPQRSAQEQQSPLKRKGRPPSKKGNTIVEQPPSTPPATEDTISADDSMQLDELADSSSHPIQSYNNATPMEVIDTLRSQISPTLPPTSSAGNTPNTSDNEMADMTAIDSPKRKRGRLVKGSLRHAAQLPPPPTPFKCNNNISEDEDALFFRQNEYNTRSIYNLQKPFEMFKMTSEASSSKTQSAISIPKAAATPSPRPEGDAHDVLGGLLTSISAQNESRIDLKAKSKNTLESSSTDFSANITSNERPHSELMDDLAIAAASAGAPLSVSGERLLHNKYPRMSRFSKEEHLRYMQTSELLKSNVG